MNRSMVLATGMALLALSAGAPAQQVQNGGVYTCIDAKGRRLTADRPIPECLDREQKVLNASGTVKQIVGPTLTAQERAAQEAKEKKEQEERARIDEAKRRDKLLVARYPTRVEHDKARAEAVTQVSVATQAAQKRLLELQQQRQKLDDEMEFYKKDPKKAPASLRSQIDDNTHSVEQQNRFIADQSNEVQRIHSRFDAELARLNQLWAPISR